VPNAQGSENQALRRHLRDKERESAPTIPPVVRIDVVRIEPTTVNTTKSRKEVRKAVRIFDRLMHGNDVPKTHGLDFLVRELFADETRDFRVRGREVHLIRLIADVLGGAVIIRKERPLQNGNLIGHATGRLEILGAQNTFGI